MGAVILIGVLADQQFKEYRERRVAGREREATAAKAPSVLAK
jgi:hypothetical protein